MLCWHRTASINRHTNRVQSAPWHGLVPAASGTVRAVDTVRRSMKRHRGRKPDSNSPRRGAPEPVPLRGTPSVVSKLILFVGLGIAAIGIWIRLSAPRSVPGASPPTSTAFRGDASLTNSGEVPVPENLTSIEPAVAERIREAVATVRSKPDSAEAHGSLGVIYDAHGFAEPAMLCFERAFALDETQPRWRYLWARLAAFGGDIDSAITAYRDVIAREPAYAPTYARLGSLLLDKSDLSGAEACFLRFIQLRPDAPFGYAGRARIHIRRSEYQQALDFLDKALSLPGNSPQAHYLRGRALQRLGRSDEARAELAKGEHAGDPPVKDAWAAVVTQTRITIEARLTTATAFMDVGRLDEAVELFQKILQDAPNDITALNNLGITSLRLGRLEEAEKVLRKAVLVNPDYFPTHLNLAMVLRSTGNIEAALTHADLAVSLGPAVGAPLRMKASLLILLNRLEESLAALLEAQRLDPAHPSVQAALGDVLSRLGRWEDAIQAMQQAVARNPQSGRFHYTLGALYNEVGRLDDAIEAFTKAASIEPDNPGIARALELVRARRGGN